MRTLNHSQIADIKPGTKIIFACVPADGHFNPLTGLAVTLANIGCDVRWYTAVKYQKKVEALGIPFYPLRKAFDISGNENIAELFPERSKHRSQIAKLRFDMIEVFIKRGPEYYADLQEIHQDFPFELMIADVTFGGIPFVKEKMQIPVIAASIVPLPETSRDLAPTGLGITPVNSFAGRIRQSILRFVANRILFSAPTKFMNKILTDYGIDPGRNNVFDIIIQKSSLVLQSGTPGFEYERSDMSPHIRFAGPLLPFQRKREGSTWTSEKLRRFNKVVLVTQGTVEQDAEKILIPTLEAFRNSDVLVIATTGGTGTEELRQRFPQDNFIIESFIPFDEVMPHADVYVSNGGYGGVLLSVKNGLPMVVGGIHEGKNEINARVGYFKLGINLGTEKPEPAQIRKAAETVLADPSYRQQVERLSQEFSTYDPGAVCIRAVSDLLNKPRIRRVPIREDAMVY